MRQVFTKVPFLADCTHEQIIDLVPRVHRMFAMPGRTLIREGRISAGLYMIARGRVCIKRGGNVLNERIVGEFIGERSLINTTPAEATCITAEFCELFLLRRQDFLDLTKRYPELLGRITFFAYRKDKASHQTAMTKNRKFLNSKKKDGKEPSAGHVIRGLGAAVRSMRRFLPESNPADEYNDERITRQISGRADMLNATMPRSALRSMPSGPDAGMQRGIGLPGLKPGRKKESDAIGCGASRV